MTKLMAFSTDVDMTSHWLWYSFPVPVACLKQEYRITMPLHSRPKYTVGRILQITGSGSKKAETGGRRPKDRIVNQMRKRVFFW